MPDALDQWVIKGVALLRLAILVGIAYTLAATASAMLGNAPADGAIPNEASAPAQSRTESKPSLQALTSRHLFGQAEASQDIVDKALPAVATRLPLGLRAVFAASEQGASSAIIAQRGKSERLYTIGDRVPGNAQLIEVYADRVILLRAGNREALEFPKGAFQAVLVDADSQAVAPDASGHDRDTDYRSSVSHGFVDERPNPVALLEDLEKDIEEVGAKAFSQYGVLPDAKGYRIGDASRNPYFRQTGLQAGDIIMAVNGQPVGDLDKDRLELRNIMAKGSASIEIDRNGERFTITARLPQ